MLLALMKGSSVTFCSAPGEFDASGNGDQAVFFPIFKDLGQLAALTVLEHEAEWFLGPAVAGDAVLGGQGLSDRPTLCYLSLYDLSMVVRIDNVLRFQQRFILAFIHCLVADLAHGGEFLPNRFELGTTRCKSQSHDLRSRV